MKDGQGVRNCQRPYARKRSDVADWTVADPSRITLAEAVHHVQPTILIGTSAQHGAFTEDVVRDIYQRRWKPEYPRVDILSQGDGNHDHGARAANGAVTVPSSATRDGPVPVTTSRKAGFPTRLVSIWAMASFSDATACSTCPPPSLTLTAAQRPSGRVSATARRVAASACAWVRVVRSPALPASSIAERATAAASGFGFG